MRKAFALFLFLSTAHGAMDDVRIYTEKLTSAIKGGDSVEMATYSTALTALILEGKVDQAPITKKLKNYGFRKSSTPEERTELYNALELISQAMKIKPIEPVRMKMKTDPDDLSSVSPKRQDLEPQVKTHRKIAQEYFNSLLGTPLAEPKKTPGPEKKNIPPTFKAPISEPSFIKAVEDAIGCLDKGKAKTYETIIVDLQAISKNPPSGFENLKSSFFAPIQQLLSLARYSLDLDALKSLETLYNNHGDLKKIVDHFIQIFVPLFKDFNEFDKSIQAGHKDPLLKITGKEAAIAYLNKQPNADTYKGIISSLETAKDTDAIEKLVKMAGNNLDIPAVEALDMLPGKLVDEVVDSVNLYGAGYKTWLAAKTAILAKRKAIDYLKKQPNAATYRNIISSLETAKDTDAIKRLVEMAGKNLDYVAFNVLDSLPYNLVDEGVDSVNLYTAGYTTWLVARRAILKNRDDRDLNLIKVTVEKILTASQELTSADIEKLMSAKSGFDGLATTLLDLAFEAKESALNALRELNKTRQGQLSIEVILRKGPSGIPRTLLKGKTWEEAEKLLLTESQNLTTQIQEVLKLLGNDDLFKGVVGNLKSKSRDDFKAGLKSLLEDHIVKNYDERAFKALDTLAKSTFGLKLVDSLCDKFAPIQAINWENAQDYLTRRKADQEAIDILTKNPDYESIIKNLQNPRKERFENLAVILKKYYSRKPKDKKLLEAFMILEKTTDADDIEKLIDDSRIPKALDAIETRDELVKAIEKELAS